VSSNYGSMSENEILLKQAVGLLPKNLNHLEQQKKQEQKESRKRYHLDEADRHKAEAKKYFADAEVAKSKGDFAQERQLRWAGNTALEKEQRERDIAEPKSFGYYHDPSEGNTTLIGMEPQEESRYDRMTRWDIERYNAEESRHIQNAIEHDKYNFKTGQLLHSTERWEGTAENGSSSSSPSRSSSN